VARGKLEGISRQRPDEGPMSSPRFHLSIPARDLGLSLAWYERVLGCRPGRRSPLAGILDLGGHQLVL
jgi:extradiol dioxygenase family protein